MIADARERLSVMDVVLAVEAMQWADDAKAAAHEASQKPR